MYTAYAALTTVLNSPATLPVAAGVALLALRPLVLLDDRMKRRKRVQLL